jgi:hypothetical protein
MGGGFDHYGMLCDAAVAHAERLQSYLATAWSDAPANERGFAEAASGCLAKLSSPLLQARRLRDHQQALIGLGVANLSMLWSKADAGFFLQGAEACTDFENLLLQGRATLDRLTFFLDFQLFPNQRDRSDRFSCLRSQLEQAALHDPCAADIAMHLASVPWLWDFFAGLERRSLRAYIAHRLAAVEWLDSCFGIIAVDRDRIVVFDAVVNGHPIFRTASRLLQEITYLTLNALCVFTTKERLPLESCLPAWENRALVFSEWHSSQPTPLWRMIARRAKPGGAEYAHAFLKMEIRDYAIVCDSSS